MWRDTLKTLYERRDRMKKFIVTTLCISALVLGLSLVACQKKETVTEQPKQSEQTEQPKQSEQTPAQSAGSGEQKPAETGGYGK